MVRVALNRSVNTPPQYKFKKHLIYAQKIIKSIDLHEIFKKY